MKYLYLIFAVAANTTQTILTKQYHTKASITNTKPNYTLYTAMSSAAAMLFFWVTAGFCLELSRVFVPYAVGFAVSYSLCMISLNAAIAMGPLSVTSLINACSLVIPTMYGILFLKDPMKGTSYAGILLLLLAVVLVNSKGEKESPMSLGWGIAVIVSFAANGMCSTLQKMQQVKCNGAYKSETMILALGLVTAFCLILLLPRKMDWREECKSCCRYAPFGGIANGILNLLVMVTTALMPSALFFPMFSAGSMCLMLIVSLTVYREKLTKRQIIGYFAGILSVILLNL